MTVPDDNSRRLTIADWQAAYTAGADPATELRSALAALPADDPAWISKLDPAGLDRRLQALAEQKSSVGGNTAGLPLYGVPFAVKDNIDAAGFATTCACPDSAYRPSASATAVARLEAAGAVVIGKTNLDQFATGLVGTRSPYGVVPNAFDTRYICGGSSSGSASVVARGLVPFALGTDTAGSGRVPAGFNNLVGLKPTRGYVSAAGVVPACRTLDCLSVFAGSVDDAGTALRIMAGFDAADPYSRHAPPRAAAWPARPVLGTPAAPEWFGDAQAERAYASALRRLEALGVELRALDFSPLFEVAKLLYHGPWVAERYAAIEALVKTRPQALHPVVRDIIERGAKPPAYEAFKAEYQRAALARKAEELLRGLDGLLVPTAPCLPTIEAVLGDPIALNFRLGRYTDFVNLLDWSAIALPAELRTDGLPAGITLIAPGWHEARLLEFGRIWQAAAPWRLGNSRRIVPAPAPPAAPEGCVTVAVVGAHLSGMPLNSQLTERGAVLLERTQTSTAYRLYALPGTQPPKPGLVRTGAGAPIAVELWAMPLERYGSFVALIPSPLGIGTLELIDGRSVQGFVCEDWAVQGARDITALGGWRAYLHQLSSAGN